MSIYRQSIFDINISNRAMRCFTHIKKRQSTVFNLGVRSHPAGLQGSRSCPLIIPPLLCLHFVAFVFSFVYPCCLLWLPFVALVCPLFALCCLLCLPLSRPLFSTCPFSCNLMFFRVSHNWPSPLFTFAALIVYHLTLVSFSSNLESCNFTFTS